MENNKTERISKAAAEYQRRQQKNKTLRTVAIVAVIVIVIGLLAASFFTSGTWYRSRTVLNVADHKISCAEFNYFYQTTVNNTYQTFYDSYGDSASILLDLSKPLDEQQFSEGVTWKDRIKELTVSSIKEVYALFDEANANGYQISEEELASASLSTAYLEEAAKNYGLTPKQYMTAAYGKGVNMTLYADCVYKTATASSYANAKAAEFTYTKEDLDAAYAEDASKFDTINLRIFPISASYATGTRDAGEAAANEMFEQITDEQSFIDLAYKYAADTDKEAFSDENATYHASIPASEMTCEGMAEWFFDEARAYGDTNVFSDDNSFYVVMYISREDNNYNERGMRHILTSFATGEDGKVTDEINAAAKTLADQYMEEWEASDKTEDTFAEMASKYSTDTGSSANGGLIEGIAKGALVTSINDWIFDDARQVGDVEMIESEYGWHIVYYTGENDINYRDALIESTLKTEASEAWYNATLDACKTEIVESVYNSNMIG